MDTICMILLGAFGVAAGFFLGSGNRAGIIGALVCGAITGVLLNLPFLADGDRLSNLVLGLSAVVGALLVNFVADSNYFKKRCRGYKNLRLSVGRYYQMGQD